jgi:hypothetical protein
MVALVVDCVPIMAEAQVLELLVKETTVVLAHQTLMVVVVVVVQARLAATEVTA